MNWESGMYFQDNTPSPENSALNFSGGEFAEPFGIDAAAWADPDPWSDFDAGNYNEGATAFAADAVGPFDMTPPGGVDITMNDVTMTLGSIINIVPAFMIRGAMALFPGLADDFLPNHRSVFGTNDKTGSVGWLVGDSDMNAGTPGVLGISASITGWLGIFGDFAEFEAGGRRHNLNTGIGHDSETFSSIGETIGQGLGVLSRKLGIGSVVESLATSIFGESDGYGFINGLQSGSWVNIGSHDDTVL